MYLWAVPIKLPWFSRSLASFQAVKVFAVRLGTRGADMRPERLWEGEQATDAERAGDEEVDRHALKAQG